MSLMDKIEEKNEKPELNEEKTQEIDKAVKKAKYYDKIGVQNGV